MKYRSPKIGVYSEQTREMQKRLSFERISLTWKTAFVWKYLGNATNDNPNIDDIQNIVFLETPDRAYERYPVQIPIHYEPLPEEAMDLSQFGIISPSSNQMTFRVHIGSFEDDALGRYLIEGDVLEVPFLEQDGQTAYFEVNDVDKKSEFEKFFVIVRADIMNDKRETSQIDDKNTNAPQISSIMDELEERQKEDVDQGGLDSSEYDNVDAPAQEEYDPRNPNQGSFLDDPDAEF